MRGGRRVWAVDPTHSGNTHTHQISSLPVCRKFLVVNEMRVFLSYPSLPPYRHTYQRNALRAITTPPETTHLWNMCDCMKHVRGSTADWCRASKRGVQKRWCEAREPRHAGWRVCNLSTLAVTEKNNRPELGCVLEDHIPPTSGVETTAASPFFVLFDH
jgi:hypothetical protein